MADGLDEFFLRDGAGDRPIVVWASTIAKAPGDFGEDMYAYDPDRPALEDGPLLGWEPKLRPNPDENTGDDQNYSPFILKFPEKGDLVLVTEDDDGNYWCLGWSENA